MFEKYTSIKSLHDLSLWDKAKASHTLLSITLEVTERCNNDCPHCYINKSINDEQALAEELSFGEIKRIVDDAVELGALWCLISGGEPLLRDDFFDVYTYLKKKGLLVSVFTNATLITNDHIDLFKKYPPRDIEVSVYGVSKKVYTKVTKRPDNFDSCMNGISKLFKANLPVTLKSTITKANIKELHAIKAFSENISRKPFRFDPFLQLRNDKNKKRNDLIRSLRLSAEEIVEIELSDPNRLSSLKKKCAQFRNNLKANTSNLFRCSAGLSECCISSNGFFKLCTALCHRDFMFNLKKTSLKTIWNEYIPEIRKTKVKNKNFIHTCGTCDIIDLCMCCPAHTDLEVNELDGFVQTFCDLAKKRYKAIKK